MLEPNGRQLLGILGKLDEQKPLQGILLPQEMPAAIAALEAAIAKEDTQRAERAQQANDEGGAGSTSDSVSLRQRARPLIDMLERAHKADKEIVWGV